MAAIQIKIPEKVKFILDNLSLHGYEAYAVGGCIRDSLMGRQPEDWDITTSAKPLQVKELFTRTVDTGLQHGTVTVMLGKEGFEVTTYRIDGEYTDHRHPKEVIFTPDVLEDLKRRDFTINAMAYNETKGLIDAFGGMEDLHNGLIRCVGNPASRFQEDALRMLRAVRFAAQLNFTVAPQTEAAILQLAPNLDRISAERVRTELVKLLVSPHPERMRDVYALGITKVVFPEFDEMMQTEQNHMHHCYSVGEHVIHSMEHTPQDKILRLTMLLHDIAKPSCKTTDSDGIDHFYGHPKKGEEIARKIMQRLKMDGNTIQRVCALVRWHDENPPLEEVRIRKTIQKIGLDQYPAIFAVKRADILAQSAFRRAEKLAYVDAYESMYEKILAQGHCLHLKQLAVTGRDLLQLGAVQGKQVGEILNRLLAEVLEEPAKNDRAYLLTQARKFL